MEKNTTNRINKALEIITLISTPWFMYLIFEWITGSLFEVRGIYLCFNLVLFSLIYLTVFTWTNAMRPGYLILNLIFTIWAIAEYFVMEFRARPIMAEDVLAIRTAMSVSDSYQYGVPGKIVVASLAVMAWSILIWRFPVRIPSLKKHILGAAATLGMGLVLITGFFRFAVPSYGIEISMWDPGSSYAQYGYLLSTLRVLGYYKVEAPEGYSISVVKQIQAEIEAGKAEQSLPWKSENDTVPTNIICIMNESFSDLSVIAPFQTDVPYLEYYDSLEENCIKGSLYMPIFGSMTSNSEFEFLTGNSMAFAPPGSVPYQIYAKSLTTALPQMLEQMGYRTTAIHANEAANWNRNEAYAYMGFDEFLDLSSFENAPTVRNYVADRGDYDKIIELTEQKEAGESLFIFDVTMQNHGGYEEEYPSTVHLTEYDGMPMTEQYLSLVRESDEALRYLLEYYKKVEEPTMIVFFGDHQPSVEPEFYEALYGQPLDLLLPEDYLRRYETPFFVWTNYPTESMLSQELSAQYLSCVLMQRANLEMSDYQYFLTIMSQTAPVVHMLGYYNSDMAWESWTNWTEKKEYPIFAKFDMLQYHNMFGKNRLLSLFGG